MSSLSRERLLTEAIRIAGDIIHSIGVAIGPEALANVAGRGLQEPTP